MTDTSAGYCSKLGRTLFLAIAWTVDKKSTRAVIGAVCTINVIARLAFVLFDKPLFGYKWFTVSVNYLEVSLSPVNYSVAKLACAGDAEERAFVISSMLAIGTAFGAWVPLLAWPTKHAPRYFNGYVFEVVLQVAYFSWTVVVMIFVHKQNKQGAAAEESGTKASKEDTKT